MTTVGGQSYERREVNLGASLGVVRGQYWELTHGVNPKVLG